MVKTLPVEVLRLIWSYITDGEDKKSCALVNWFWYSDYFASKVLASGQYGIIPLDKFTPDKAEWFNKAYAPYITNVITPSVRFDVVNSGLRFANLRQLTGDLRQVLSMLRAPELVRLEKLESVEISGISGNYWRLDRTFGIQLFDVLGSSNVTSFTMTDESVFSCGQTSSSVVKFLNQLEHLEMYFSYIEIELFPHMTNLESIVMKEYSIYADLFQEQGMVAVPDDYLGQVCHSLSSHSPKLSSLYINDEDDELEKLNHKHFEGLVSIGKLEVVDIADSIPENRKDVNIFTLNIDGVSSFADPCMLKSMSGLNIYKESTLTKVGLACRQLERIEIQIRVDFSKISVPKGTVLFPNLSTSLERVVSTSSSNCLRSFVREHMPKAKFYHYGIFCCHCVERNGGNMDVPDDPMYPTWTGFVEKDCPNLKDIQIDLYIPADSYFEQCD